MSTMASQRPAQPSINHKFAWKWAPRARTSAIFSFSGAGSAHGDDVRCPSLIRRLALGPRTSAPQPTRRRKNEMSSNSEHVVSGNIRGLVMCVWRELRSSPDSSSWREAWRLPRAVPPLPVPFTGLDFLRDPSPTGARFAGLGALHVDSLSSSRESIWPPSTPSCLQFVVCESLCTSRARTVFRCGLPSLSPVCVGLVRVLRTRAG